ncbi:hypothetical protein PT974_11336 [Cladobotryum mycophilum]|uniref:Uncharacterized protein n=1 Tax=Cladobotryum mycophilum TaxID=491253 RepID=A0ABR0S5U7_9HYPO
MATLGVPPEIALQEEIGNNSTKRFPSLSYCVSYKPKCWIPRPERIHLEKVFLARSSPHCQLSVREPLPHVPDPVLESPKYMRWATSSDIETLYIHGRSYSAAHDIADRIFLAWQAQCRDRDINYRMALSFTFDSADPLRNSASDMLASIIVHYIASNRFESLNHTYPIL